MKVRMSCKGMCMNTTKIFKLFHMKKLKITYREGKHFKSRNIKLKDSKQLIKIEKITKQR